MRVEAKTDALASIYTALTLVASGDTAREIAAANAEIATGKVKECFAKSRDPYGVKWPKPQRGNKPGTLTGTLRGDARAVHLDTRIQLRSGVPYARFFFRGTSKMVARAAFPDSRGIPPAWKKEFENAARRIVARKLRRQGRA